MALNEHDGIKAIMPKINTKLFEQILVLDGGSTDGTQELARSMGYEVYQQKQKGLHHAYKEVMPLIRGEALILFSPDGNSLPEALEPLITKFNKDNYDMVIASRYCDGASSEDDDPVTAFGNWLFTNVINLVYGTKYSDAMVMYRIFKKELFYQLDLDRKVSFWPEKLFLTTISIEPLLSMRAGTAKLKVGEIGANEPVRIGGKRKLQIIRWGCSYMLQLLTDRLWWKPNRKD